MYLLKSVVGCVLGDVIVDVLVLLFGDDCCWLALCDVWCLLLRCVVCWCSLMVACCCLLRLSLFVVCCSLVFVGWRVVVCCLLIVRFWTLCIVVRRLLVVGCSSVAVAACYSLRAVRCALGAAVCV